MSLLSCDAYQAIVTGWSVISNSQLKVILEERRDPEDTKCGTKKF